MIESDFFSAHLKLEHHQKAGSYHFRGALASLLNCEKPVVTAAQSILGSSIAHAARELGLEVTIVMPEGSDIDECRRLGANVVEFGRSLEEASIKAMYLAEESEQTFVHPTEDAEVICGYGTLALELMEAQPDVVVVPFDETLIAGLGVYLQSKGVRVVGAMVDENLEE